MGSGTTNFAAQRMSRNSIGIEIKQEYYDMVQEQIDEKKLVLFEPEEIYETAKLNGRN